jgi:DNA adenine methylase
MTSTIHSPAKRVGGKHASAERIVAAFPPATSYKTYCEPCCGALHVLFCKPYDKHHDEIISDLDNNLITFWQQMLANGQAIAERMETLPYSRKWYYDYYRSLFDGTEMSDFERACRYFYALRGTGTGWLRRSPVGWNYQGKAVRAFRSVLEVFEVVQERLQFVSIDNRDIVATIKRTDSVETFFYIDPPYLGAEQYYEASKKGFPHEEVAALLQKVKGKVAFSCYPHPLIDEWYPVNKWRRLTWTQPKSSDIQSETQAMATEVLLMNYPAEATTLWDNPSHIATQIASWSTPVEAQEEEESA